MVQTSAPGNLFFFGEHSVVYGRPAILAAIDKRTYVDIASSGDETISVKSEGYGSIDVDIEQLESIEFRTHNDYNDSMDPILDLISYFHDSIKTLDSGFKANIWSDIPRNSGGMSSSTAVLCSFLAALSNCYGVDIEKREYFDHIYPIQVKIHGGSASGSEITSSSLGGYNKFVIDKTGDDAKFNFENIGKYSYNIVIGDSGVSAGTGQTVPYVRDGWNKDRQSYEDVFDEIADIARQGEKALINGNAEKVGSLMNKNQEMLRILGVSHPRLEKMVKSAIRAGALGAKLSGGGKGGCMVALCEADAVENVAKALRSVGRESYITNVGVSGVRTE